MTVLNLSNQQSRQTITQTFIAYLAISVILFLFLMTLLLLPQVRSTFYGMQDQTDEISAQTREDPDLTVLDVNAQVMFSENGDEGVFPLAEPILNGDVERVLTLETDAGAPQFKLAVPIVYGNGIEGVIVARFSAQPEMIYDSLNESSGVSIRKDGRTIAQAVEGISRVDPNGRYTEVNMAYAGTADYHPDELMDHFSTNASR